MYQNILVPLDGSKLAEDGIPEAINLAGLCGAKITLMQVAEITPVLKSDREIETNVLKDRAEKYLGQLKEGIEKEGVPAEIVIQTGKNPYSVIVAYAKENDVDLIMMSTHGMGGFERAGIGSVSDKVVRDSPVPVLLIRSFIKDALRGKTVLAVDDEPDVLEILEEQLDMCKVHKATSYETAIENLRIYDYDLAVLDIMGVNGFELLKKTVAKGIPSVMLTANALTSDSLRKSFKGGACFFVPKEKIGDIEKILAEIVKRAGKPIWAKMFGRFTPYFSKRFRWSKEDQENIMKELEATSR